MTPDLSTTYLGLKLRSPLVCSSSPLCADLEALRQLEEHGAGAVVLHSLFEEQIELESTDLDRALEEGTGQHPEAQTYLPDLSSYNFGPDGYVEHLREAKALLRIPVIASLNGHTRGGWVRYAKLLEEAGTDALELNVYEVPTDPERDAARVEQDVVDLVGAVAANLKIPLAVKIGPFYSAPANLARRLEAAGARGLVLFNRFYQPDFDLETLEATPNLRLSTPDELRLRLHWTAILFGRVSLDLAVTGGVHAATDVLKVLLAGGRVAMMTSALLKNGLVHLRHVLSDLRFWLEDHDCASVGELLGGLSLASCPDPSAFERGNYMKVLRSYALHRGPR
jgi:dihydroorotate dehydrogenase (fumarate)